MFIFSVTMLRLVGGAPGGDTARRRFIGGGRVPRLSGVPPSNQDLSMPFSLASGCKTLASTQKRACFC